MKTLLITLAALSSLAGCGSDSYECCYNRLYYDCGNKDTLARCASGLIAECDRDETKDSHCD